MEVTYAEDDQLEEEIDPVLYSCISIIVEPSTKTPGEQSA